MSLVYQFTVLALASTVLAVPHIGHGHAHAHRHLHSYPSSLPFPYSRVNGTSIGYKGTGIPYSTPSSIPGYPSKIPSSVPAYGISGTLTSTDYETVTQTIQYPSSSVSEAAAGYGYGSGSGSSAASGDQCGLEVTVTSTEKVYVTVTAGQAPSSSESSPVESSYSRPTSTVHITHTHTVGSYGSSSSPSVPAYSASSSSSQIVPVYSSKAPVYSPPSASVYSASSSSSESVPVYSSTTPIYSAPTSSISVASYETSSSSESVASYSISSTSTLVLPILSTYSPVAKQVGTSSASSAAAVATSSSTPSSGGKRGLAYNAADLTTCFDDSKEISWAYNWVSASAGLTGNLNFIPTLHDGSALFTSVWNTEASASIATGSNTLFSFNEPDMPSQANMSPEAAAALYKQYMNPFGSQAKLCAPSVSNSQEAGQGLEWLSSFVSACTDCQIDCYNIHWYNVDNTTEFKEHVGKASAIAGNKPIYISEFGVQDCTDDEVSTFLEDVMPWMDSNDAIAGYAYYWVADGELLTGDVPSTIGKTYMSYTA